MVDGPGVVTGRYGTIGLVHYVETPFWPLNTTLYVQDFKGNYPRFVYYLLKTIRYSDYLDKAAVPGINRNDVHQAKVFLPPIPEQKSIAQTMLCIDERIRTHQKQNITLEEVTRAIFKSWFVDFDPVRAKAEGRVPEGMDADTAALFPCKFVDSKTGALPKDWTPMPLYGIAEFSNGAAYKDIHFSPRSEGLPIIKIAELKAGVTESTKFTVVDLGERYRIEQDEVLFSWSGNPDTSIDTFIWSGGPAWLNQHIFRVRENGTASLTWAYVQLKELRSAFAEIARDKQTTGLGHVTIADMKRLMVCKPSAEVAQRFDEVASPLLDRIASNQLTVRLLASIRDTLLPRLISGKLRLPDAEKLIEAVV
jgi:type I restriction enzyme S subunit